MNRSIRSAGPRCALAVLILAAFGASGAFAQSSGTAMGCADIESLAIPASVIGLPTDGGLVTASELVEASGEGTALVPQHCLVSGSIHPIDTAAPDILFQLALPMAWNSKIVMFGGGGFDGSIPKVAGNVPAGPGDQPTPLARGYATFGSDSGHQANEFGSQDGSFALNQEAARNFGGEALKKTRDAAVFLIKTHYDVDSVAQAYFAGGSTGGREALASITRWPEDWDGAIAWYPAWNDAAALLGGHRANRALAQPGAYPDTPARELIFNAAMASCDSLDGVEDGLISNQTACNAGFDPSTAEFEGKPIQCGEGAGNLCLSEAQIAALKAMNTPTQFNFPLASGETHYPGYNVWGSDLGITSNPAAVQPVVTFLALGTAKPEMPMPRSTPYISVLLDQWIKYSVTRDPDFNSLVLDPENPGAWAGRISELSTLLDTRVDLEAFAAGGGKLLLAHGLSDVLVSTRATEEYYLRLQSQMSPSEVDKFVRYYEVPGYGHAVSSVFNASWDSLTALEEWVEDDVAPKGQIVADTVGVPGRTRPLCNYPQWPKYTGHGDVNDAASFACAN